jgi:hypothetical protein
MSIITGFEFAEKVAAAFGTREVYAIATAQGVTIARESWYPITVGEYERKSQTIWVNEQALVADDDTHHVETRIIAHELGHHFAARLDMDRETEERFAHEFAHALVTRPERVGV